MLLEGVQQTKVFSGWTTFSGLKIVIEAEISYVHPGYYKVNHDRFISFQRKSGNNSALNFLKNTQVFFFTDT